jgi:hypothetical protein
MKHLLFVSALLFVTPAWSQALVVATCGSGAYTVGQLHQLTMNPAGYLCVSTTTVLGMAIKDQGGAAAPSEARTPPEAPKPPTPPAEPKK